jgi:hypothetical protein
MRIVLEVWKTQNIQVFYIYILVTLGLEHRLIVNILTIVKTAGKSGEAFSALAMRGLGWGRMTEVELRLELSRTSRNFTVTPSVLMDEVKLNDSIE